ncbi:HypC/HybG/HupF family hydrogenase formation chaperone [Inconstantimicrobium porci]|uniref:HypC/HybG/HupF family hydrogenase formation chaperone n=1 Tax=Inconstantimicrobium porci TaxID=2652291 RepID=UPI0024097E0F|nr:HypC/HybG/HupF family hydrogenase formation chaperone [Inconstantimicrobium porci]MDD6770772.1 HypC/HybG/HupF family hydrogenase formation chaperone [Inconstantimicrobium porci]
MCVAVPGRIIEIHGDESVVDFGSIKKLVNTCLIEDIKIGDYVLGHVGCAVDKIDQDEAEKTTAIFMEILLLMIFSTGILKTMN